MQKPSKKTVNISDLFVDFDLNIRQKDNYDLATLKEQIIAAGRILKPMVVKPSKSQAGKYVVLQGNRRTLAGQELMNDPATPQEVVKNLEKVDVLVFDELSPNDELALIMDHSGEKPICRTEVVVSIWRLSKAFMSEGEIINLLYYPLAKYSGNEKKLLEVPVEKKAREKFLKSWMHGTVGNYILSASSMGDFVRQQFILTHREQDKLLTEAEKPQLVMKTSRERITQLSAAITADKDSSKGGTGWTTPEFAADGKTVVGGGTNFNALIEKFKDQDINGGEPRPTRPTVKELTEKASNYKSPAIKTALAIAAGENVSENGRKLVEMDDAWTAISYKCEIIGKHVNDVKDPQVKELLRAILEGPAGGVQEALKPFIA